MFRRSGLVGQVHPCPLALGLANEAEPRIGTGLGLPLKGLVVTNAMAYVCRLG